MDRIQVHGRSLEGNLEGDSPDRDVSVYLPPSYKTDAQRRYPVVYMLHGFTDSVDKWFRDPKHFINLPSAIDRSIADNHARDVIVVMPDAYTRYKGSMYSSSAATGDWEEYIAHDLVAYIDAHYRTIPNAHSRGLAGHSMGGYGTIRIAMKKPGVFSSIYVLSPCCMAPGFISANPQMAEQIAQIHTPADIEHASFFVSALFASAAAWAPDPKNPPFYLDLPLKDGQPLPPIQAKLTANAPLAMIDQYIPAIRGLTAIAFDAGTQDAQIAATCRTLDQVLSAYGIAHTFETYEGTHTSRIAERVQTKTMPFFSEHLAFQ